MTDYSEILQGSWDAIPEPKLLPTGHWLLKGRNATFIEGKDDQNARVLFFYVAKEPMEDVQAADLEALGSDYDFGENDVAKTFWIERKKDWDAVRKHLVTHGVDVATLGIQESLKAFRNTEVVAYLDQRAFTTRDGQAKEENVPSQFEVVK